ncbi:MAG: glycosyltransferase family 87 protein, partial [Rhizomicrobium sp.]
MNAGQSEATTAGRGWRTEQLFPVAASGILLGYLISLGMVLHQRGWILQADGKPAPCDFLAYWAAGLDALSGHAASAYDIHALHAAQVSQAGPFPDYLYWNYPPSFFFVAVLLASLPYVPAFLGWVMSTCTAYALAIGAIARRREAVLGACASPVIMLTAFAGQNGFLSAALFGGSLLFLPTRPIVGGLLMGLMTYKPQFGILLPVVLIAGGHWRALWAAAAVAAFMIVSSALVFGVGTYIAFLHSLPVVSHAYLTMGGEGWTKMQSIYSIARFLGAGDSPAWAAQTLTMLGCAGIMIVMWRRKVPYELKAAALVTAAMLATPYLHVYDFPVLLVAIAFLYRHRPFDRVEWAAVVAANLSMVLFLAQLAPIGPGIILLIGSLVLRRVVGLSVSVRRLWESDESVSPGDGLQGMNLL